MWIKPYFRITLGIMLAALLWIGAVSVTRLPVFQLQQINVLGTQHVSAEQILGVTQPYLHSNLFYLDLGQVQASFKSLAWVLSADVRRKWPNQLNVQLVENIPTAYWNSAGLVNQQGDVFMAASNAHIPHFSGPSGSSEQVAQAWVAIQKILAPIGRQAVDVALNERGSWTVQLDNGVSIALGRDEQRLNRLSRWVSVYPAMLAQLTSPLVSVDLRYPQGFAVQLLPTPATPAAPAQRKLS